MSRLVNYQIRIENINDFPTKLTQYAGREVNINEIWSISFTLQLNEMYCHVSLWDSTKRPFKKEFAL
jgi:hypothetical protein